MDKQKMLWVVFAFTIVIVLGLGAGMVALYPRAKPKADLAKATSPLDNGQDISAFIRDAKDLPSVTPETKPADDVFVPDTSKTDVTVGTETRDASGQTTEPVINVKSTTTTTPAPATQTPVITLKPAQTTATPAPTTASASSGSSGSPTQRTTPVAKTPAPTTQTVTVNEYWIQVGSFTTLSKAESVKQVFSAKGYPTRIFTVEQDGTKYRVRLGPFSKKDDADSRLVSVKAVAGYEGSYVSLVQTQQVR